MMKNIHVNEFMQLSEYMHSYITKEIAYISNIIVSIAVHGLSQSIIPYLFLCIFPNKHNATTNKMQQFPKKDNFQRVH